MTSSDSDSIIFGAITLILLDRDGVINFDSPDYIKSPDEWQPIPGALEAIAALQKKFTVAICTNQSGVGRGYYSERTLSLIHDKLNQMLLAQGGACVDIYYCPHLPDADCLCRKPLPGLLQTAMQANNCNPQQTLYVGDSIKDLIAADNAGCGSALVRTGNGKQTAKSQDAKRATIISDDLAILAMQILDV